MKRDTPFGCSASQQDTPFPALKAENPCHATGVPVAWRGPRGKRYSKLCIELAVIKDRIDDAVFNGLLSGQNLIAVSINADLLSGTTSVLRQGGFHQLTHALNLGGLDLQVRNLALGTLGRRLVDKHAGVWQRCALARRPRS